MKNTLLLILFLMPAPAALADNVSCNVGGKALFKLIDLDTASNLAKLTDNFGNQINGKIVLVRNAGDGKRTFNISFGYELNNQPASFDLILAPVSNDVYSVGMAGYVWQDRKKILEVADREKAMCF